MKRYFILSDIHAQYDLLIDALTGVEFDSQNPDHILIIVGDVLDRGSQGDMVIRFLELMIKRHRLLGVMGNHDDYLIEILKGHYHLPTITWAGAKNGFYQTLALGKEHPEDEISLSHEGLETIRKNFLERYPLFCDWLLNLPLFLEFKHHVIVHAFLDFSLNDWHDTTKKFAVWERRYDEHLPDTFEKTLVFGHTPNMFINRQNDIIRKDRKIMIDGGAAAKLQINVLCLNEDEI